MPVTVEERVALALAALAEVTDPEDVGALLDAEAVEPGVIDLRFGCTMPGYTGWRWTVSTTDLADTEPTVLEVELLPADGALVAPPWVPWTERLAEWRRQHPDEAEAAAREAEQEADDEDVDEDDLDADDDLADDLAEEVLEGADVEHAAADAGADEDEDGEPDEDGDDEPDEELDEDGRAARPADEDRSL